MSLPTAESDDDRPVATVSPAIAMIDEGNALEERGRSAEAMARYEAAARADPRCARAHLNRGNVLFAGADIDEARSAYQLAIACDPHYAAAHFNLGNLNYLAGERERAVQNYQVAIAIRPDFADAFVALGNTLDDLGRIPEAVASYERALAIAPGDARIHFNLGVLAFTEGRLEQAEAILRRASSIAPESEDILCQLALVLMERSKSLEALQLMMRRLEVAPTWRIKEAFGSCVARVTFTMSDAKIRAALTAAVTEAWATPFKLCRPVVGLITLDPRIASRVRLVNESWPMRLPKAAILGEEDLAPLASDALLHAILQTAPVSTVEFERFLTAARHALLETAMGEQAPGPSDIAALPFYAALARQCFINEYVFDCDDGEVAQAAACRQRLVSLLDANAEVPPLLLLAGAAYFPLYSLPGPARLLACAQSGPLEGVLRQQIREPLEERALRAGIESLTAIAEGVSEQVRDQYEQNPYPRWVKVPVHSPELHFNAELRRTLPRARFTPLRDDSRPEMLIAGCGTGSQPIPVSQRFRGIRILAVDLSLNSIGYAMRKTRELGIANIEYAQADIMKLGELARTFDLIACGGVLHHLADPFAGWRILLSRLRPGGFMHLALYSQLARTHVVEARQFIASRGYTGTAEGIRRFRRDVTEPRARADLQLLSKRLSETPEFFSTSECRDLVFHVQEHRLTLDRIESFLSECGLHFLGFELDPIVLQQYRLHFADDPAGTNLRNWARFESDHPGTFVGMYNFWIQRPVTQGGTRER